jgi:hypothetical protein
MGILHASRKIPSGKHAMATSMRSPNFVGVGADSLPGIKECQVGVKEDVHHRCLKHGELTVPRQRVEGMLQDSFQNFELLVMIDLAIQLYHRP